MKKIVKKTCLSLLAAGMIFTAHIPVYANPITVTIPTKIYETISSENISSGVKHENILRFTTEGWWNINILRIDLNDRYTELKGLFNEKGLPNRDKVSSMVEKSGAVAGINGDYFDYQPLPSSLGTLINNGELISSPIGKPYTLPSFYITNHNNAGIEYLDRRMVVTNRSNNQEVIIDSVNKVSQNFGTVTLLNKHWGAKSIGNRFHNDLVEVLVLDGSVADVRIGGEAFDIPKEDNSYVLAVRGTSLQGLNIGDRLHLELLTVPDLDGIKFAIGGGSIILKDGELALTNINSKGNEPRTGIGINRDQTELVLVTIDGRDSSFKGVSQEMFGSILRELGAYNGLNLDGGGSSTMAVKPIDEEKAKVVNKPSDGGERAVVNGVGVFSNAPQGELSYLKLKTDDSKMFINTKRAFSVKGYDEYHNPVDIDESLITFTVEGLQGEFDGNKFKASSSGEGKIFAEYNGVLGYTDLNVLGEIVELNTSLNNFNIDLNSEQKLSSFTGKDKNGTKAKVYLEDIQFDVIGNIGEVKNGVFYSGNEALGGAISARAGNGIANILVSVGSKGILVDGFETIEKYNFTAYPENVIGNISLNNEARDGLSSLSLNYDFTQGENTRAAYLNFNPNGAKGLKFDGYPKKIGFWVKGDGSGIWLRGTLKDNSGNEHVLDFMKTVDFSDWQYVTASIPTNVSYPVSLQRIYIAETDSVKKPTGSILIDGLTAYYPTSVGNVVLPTPTTVKDDLASKKTLAKDGFSFIVAAEPKGLDELVGYNASSKLKSRISQSKIGVMLKGITPEFNKGLTNYSLIDASNAYKIGKHSDVIFFNLDSSKGGLRASNASQWMQFINDLDSRHETNFAIFLPTPVFGTGGFSDKLEADLFHNKLTEAKKKGKNIFVVQGGSQTKSELIDGIRYIQLNTKDLTKPEDIYKISVVEFVVNGSDISYEIVNVFPQPKITAKK